MKKAILVVMAVVLVNAVAFGQKGDGPRDVADRIRGDGARAENRGDKAGAREARDRAREAERSTPERAREIEREYNRGDRRSEGGGGRSPAGDRDRGPRN
jgi:hypothetical protein